ncbi:hypothetical protein HDU96_006756 [Phlyctochytrium bullatum]|nr:hypothetical protein HDU96_006756 [Phlyctochytrium bullatum]
MAAHHLEVSRSMSMADGYADSSKVDKKPTWSPSFAMTVTALTKLFHKYKDDLDKGKKIIEQMRFPRPVHVKVKKVYIPRRADVLPAGMSPDDATGSLKAEWVDPSLNANLNVPAKRVIIYAHGWVFCGRLLSGVLMAFFATGRGVYVMCSRKTHRAVTWRLAKYAGARVLSIDYRLSPKHPFPLPINDMVSAYLHLIDPPEGSGLPRYRPDQIVFMGDSAGGNLSLVSMLQLRMMGKPVPAGLGLICPWMDVTHGSPSFVFNAGHDFLPSGSADPKYIQEGQIHYYVPPGVDMKQPLVSPLYAKEDPANPFPPMLIQIGGAERLRDESISFFAETCPNSSIQLEVYEDMVHVWHLFAAAENVARLAIRRLAAFAIEVTSTAAAADDAAASAPPRAASFARRAVNIRNRRGFPEEPFDDPAAHLQRERARLRAFVEAGGNAAAAKTDAEEAGAVLVMVDVEGSEESDGEAARGETPASTGEGEGAKAVEEAVATVEVETAPVGKRDVESTPAAEAEAVATVEDAGVKVDRTTALAVVEAVAAASPASKEEAVPVVEVGKTEELKEQPPAAVSALA